MFEDLNYLQLTQKRDQLKKEMEEIDKLINSSSEIVKKYFELLNDGEFKNLLASKIRRIEKGQDTTDSRKNPIEYTYIIFETIEGETWKIAWGHNWCSNFNWAGECSGFDDDDLYDSINFSEMSEDYYWGFSDKKMELEEFLKDLLKINGNIIDGHFLAAAIFNACEYR